MREGVKCVKPPARHRAALGKLGEGVALLWYLLQGWQPHQRPRHERVQTDLLLRRGQTLLLVEVKARWQPQPFERLVSPQQRKRLHQQVAWWAAQHPSLTVRLEVAQVTWSWPLVRRYALNLA